MEIDDNYSVITDFFVDLEIDLEETDPDISDLSPDEIKKIAVVIEKDKALRREERKRRKKLEESIDEKIVEIGLKNVDDGEKFCFNCGEKFTFWINPKRQCIECTKGICNGCTYLMIQESRVCYLCYLKACKEVKTGKWFAVTSKENGRFRRNPTAVIVNSMRKLRNKFSTVEIPVSSNLEMEFNIPNGSIRNDSYKPIYVRKEATGSLKRDIIKDVIQIQKENAVDVVDIGSIDQINGSKTSDTKERLQTGNQNPHSSNLENMKNLSASSHSIYSETFESYKSGLTISGDILFSVFYDESNSTLNIYVDQCRNLAIAERGKRATNPYIKTYLLPDKTKISKKKSTHKKGSVNPIFKETLTYKVTKENLQNRTLSVAVWHKRFMTFNYFLGEVHILLADLDLSNKVAIWYPLAEKVKYPNRSGGHIYKGELIIKLKYKPSARKEGKGSLHVLIVEAHQLETEGQTLNAYVKGYLLPDRSNKTKKKTPVQKSQSIMKWDCLLQFTDITLEELKERSLELSIYHHRKMKSNEFLGGVRLNLGIGLCYSAHVPWMDAQGTEKTTWENFLANPNDYTDSILNLRANLEY